MNLKEEYHYQKKVKVWDDLGLSEKNRKLAEQYMDTSQPENEELLKEVERQCLKKVETDKKRRDCVEYLEYCREKSLMEDVKRYVRFVTAVGGSTAYYVLYVYYYQTWNWDRNKFSEYLTREQLVAIEAERFAWTASFLKQGIDKIEETNPEVFREAMQLCCQEYDNTKILLAGLYLHYTKPIKVQTTTEELSKENQIKQKQIQETIDFLINSFHATIPEMLKSGQFSEKDKKELKAFMEESGENTLIPNHIFTILNGKKYDDYLITLLAGSAFLAIEHSKKFLNCLKLTTLMDKENNFHRIYTTLDSCLLIHTREWFVAHINIIEEQLPIDIKKYLVWCVKNEIGEPIKRLSVSYPEKIKQVKQKMTTEEFLYLLRFVKEGNLALYEEINGSFAETYRVQIAQKIVEDWGVGHKAAKNYLLGEVEIEVLYPFVKEWRERGYIGTIIGNKIISLRKMGNQQMYQRAVVLMALALKRDFFRNYWIEERDDYGIIKDRYKDKEHISAIIRLLSKEKVPVIYQLELLASIYDDIYFYTDGQEVKEIFLNNCIQVIAAKKSEWENDIMAAAKNGNVWVRQLCIQVLNTYWQDYKEILLSCIEDTSKQIQPLLITIYTSHKEWEAQIKELLNSKKSQEREVAVRVLRNWGIHAYRKELLQAMEKEKSKKIKELIQGYLGMQEEEVMQGEKTKEELIAEILKGGRKRTVLWAYETPFPTVHKLDGSEASEDYMKAILVSYADMQKLGVNADAVKLAKELEPNELTEYMKHLFDKWLKLGAESKKKWVLYAVSVHGGETMIPVLYAQIQEWSSGVRGAIAADAVKALALNGGVTALLLVDQISKKFKHRQVKAAASEALTYAAEQLGITKEELEDRIVPNLGFNEQMERVFDYGTRKFTVALTPALELLITDESGKKIKSLPAPGKRDEEEKAKAANAEYKLLKKQLKTVVTNQKMRLEQALSTERLWKATQWKELFVKNPVMHQFAIGLIWGRYEEGQLKETFRYMEDGSFNTVEEDEYKFPEEGKIGLVHPIELNEEELEAWKEQLSDYEITQPIEQIERTVYRLTEEEKLQTELTRFGGKVLNGLSLSGKLLGFGWYRGSIQDAGCYFTFYKEDGAIGVELEFSGAGVGWEGEEDVAIYGVQFYKAGTVKRGSYVYDEIKTENLYVLYEVNPRYFSEIVLQLTKVTASSVKQLEYPECKKQY